MRVLIEGTNTPSVYQFAGLTAVLRIEAIKGFTTFNGQLVPPSTGNEQDFYLEVALDTSGEQLLIPTIEIDSTEDAYPWDSSVTGDVPGYRAYFKLSNGRRIPYFNKFKVPTLADGDPSMQWDEIRVFNRTFVQRFTGLDRYINVNEVQEWIQNAVGELNKASENNFGVTILDVDPVIPGVPIAVGVNSPLLSAGNWLSNTRAAITAAYDLTNDDKGKTIALGGAAYYSLTVDTASGFDADFQALILNEDSVRAKRLVIDGLTTFLLYPGQSMILYNQNNVWQTFKTTRWRVPASCTIFVDSVNGDDANDGFAAGAGNAMATVQGAYNRAKNDFDLGLRATPVVIQLSIGTHVGSGGAPVLLASGPFGGAQMTTNTFPSTNEVPIVIRGDTASPANYILSSASALACVQGVWGAVVAVEGVTITNSVGGGINSAGGGGVQHGWVIFGNCGTAMVGSNHGSICENYGPVWINGNAPQVYSVDYHSSLYLTGTIQLLADITVTDFIFADRNSDLSVQGATIDLNGHTVTGRRFQIKGNASITLSITDDEMDFFPGSAAGIIVGGGIYNSLSGLVYTPTVTSTTGTITTLGTVTGRYTRPATNFHMLQIDLVIVTNGGGGGFVKVTLPEPAAGLRYVLNASNFSSGIQLQARIVDTDPTAVFVMKPDNTYPGADNTRIVISGWYEST